MLDFCPYEMLNIEQNARDSEIKKSYRSLSKQYHPDKVGDNQELSEKFTKITSAKELLLDHELRSAYDQGGWQLVEHIKQMRSMQQHQIKKCEPYTIESNVSLKQLYNHEEIKFNFTVPKYLEDGSCVDKPVDISFHLHKIGKIGFQSSGIERPDHVNGDIVIDLNLSDEHVSINGLDIVYRIPLNLLQIINGYQIVIEHPSGSDYSIKGKYCYEDGNDDNILIFENLGVKNPDASGNMIVQFIPDLTTIDKLSPELISKITKLLETETETPKNITARDITEVGKKPSQMRRQHASVQHVFAGNPEECTIS